jgi:uncharacterized protein
MVVRNSTRATVLSESVRALTRWSEAAQGLIAEEKPEAMFLRTRWGIHTFGVRFPIDVIVFDDANVVRAMRASLKPFRFFFWNPQWENVLELPAGTIVATHTEVGDALQLE